MQGKDEIESLKLQVREIMDEPQSGIEPERDQAKKKVRKKTKKKHKFLKVILSLFVMLLLIIALIIGTKSGRRVIYKMAGDFIYRNMDVEESMNDIPSDTPDDEGQESIDSRARYEDYVTNYLIFGIEEFGGAKNTDTMMIASINTKDNSIKLTSLLRDSYVEIPGYKSNKLNAAYSRGGVALLINTIEQNYRIQIDGYASVNFKSFEKIVDSLGGISIELGKKESEYLNKTNYISNKKNRNVKPGVNVLNGNQALGYSRVRKVATLGGANNDYGRAVRQQRVLEAIFDKIKSKNIIQQLDIMKECLGYVTTNLDDKQIKKAIEDVVENKIKTLDTFRVPVDGAFDAPKKYNGIGYPLVLDWDKNLVELYQYIFLDTEKEAKAALEATKE